MITRKKRMKRWLELERRKIPKKKVGFLDHLRNKPKKKQRKPEDIPSKPIKKTTLEKLLEIETINLETILIKDTTIPKEVFLDKEEFVVEVIDEYANPEESEKTIDIATVYDYNTMTKVTIMKSLRKKKISFRVSDRKRKLFDLLMESIREDE